MESEWPMGMIPLTEKELKDLLELAEKTLTINVIRGTEG